MTDQHEQVVPLFTPPLASLLAAAEQEKGGALTEIEVLGIRDQSACIMVDCKEAKAVEEKRGFVDVNPNNCWADWHRLRVELTGNGCLPKIVLCLLGDASFALHARTILEDAEIEYELSDHDDRMTFAFRSAAAGFGSALKNEDYDLIDEHESVLYVLSENLTEREAAAASDSFLHLGRALLQRGGIAIKCESSGTAHSKDSWCQLSEIAANPASSPLEIWSALFQAYVQYPVGGENDLYSCGMHLLGKPDFVISTDLLARVEANAGSPPQPASLLFGSFASYLLDQCSVGGFSSGQAFRPNLKWPSLGVVWEACSRWEEDDFFFNPFGLWRFKEML